MKHVEIDPSVVMEIVEAVAWYEEREEGVGRRFSLAVDAAFAALPTHRLKPLRDFAGVGAVFVGVGGPWPYRLIVIERGTSLWVVALAHARRQPGYWIPRLDG